MISNTSHKKPWVKNIFHLNNFFGSSVHLYATAGSEVSGNLSQIFSFSYLGPLSWLNCSWSFQENSSRCAFLSFKPVH